jgi:cobyrinic acid a,c-diamide synthase
MLCIHLLCSNMTLLTSAGVQLVPFSPLRDGRLPPGLSGVLLGGGPAHRWVHHLAANGPMLAALRAFAAAGGLVWAEGSGLVYVSQSLTTGMQQHVLGEWPQQLGGLGAGHSNICAIVQCGPLTCWKTC